MADETEMPQWRKKFIATRMTFESILFERELMNPQREKLSAGLLGLGGIWLFNCLLLAQWVFRRGYFLSRADSEGFTAVLRYSAYLKSQGFLALIKPELSDLTLNPPLYYLSYVPVLKYLTSDLNLALVLVNSFFLLVLALAIFVAVRKSRPNRAGWLGAAFALALPFVIETSRSPSPELALLALVAAMYACYIRSDDFENPKWAFAFAVCLGLGFFAHRFFWLYTLPLVPFILTGLASPMSRDDLFKGFFPGAVINLPWYLFALAVLASGLVPLWGAYGGFWHYLKLGAVSAGLPLFILGAAGLGWMYFSVFMPYDKKKMIAAWFWVPYLVLTCVVRGSRPELLGPALLPFAVALPVMTPHQARKYLLVFVLALGALNQSGLLRTVSAGAYPLAGLPLPPSADYRAAELTGLISAGIPASGGLVAVYGGDVDFNSASFRFITLKTGAPVKFADNPACPACASVLLHKTTRFGDNPFADKEPFSVLKGEAWFPATFVKKAEFVMADASRVEVYAKIPAAVKFFVEGEYQVKELRFGPLSIPGATLKLANFDEKSGAYASAELFAPAAEIFGGDVYGLTLDISGLSAAGGGTDPFVPSGFSSVRVRSAKISAYAVEQYLARRYPFLSEIKVDLKNNLGISAMVRGSRLDGEFALSISGGGALEVRPVSFSLGPVKVSEFLLHLFTFRLDFSDNPYGLKIKGLRIASQLLEIY